MYNKKIFNLLLTLIFIVGCAPKQSAINGDVFLTMGNGSIKPVAGAEIYLFPLEADLDSSFVDPLKLFINNAKFNVSKSIVQELCSEADNEFSDSGDFGYPDYATDGVFNDNIELECSNFSNEIISLEKLIASLQSQADDKSKPYSESLILKKKEEVALKSKLYSIAVNEGNKLKNEQMQKVSYNAKYGGITSEYSSYTDVLAEVINNSDYVILSIDFSPVKWREKDLSFNKNDRSADEEKLLNLYRFTGYYFSGIMIGPWSLSNSYGESIPGKEIGATFTSDLYTIKLYDSWEKDRWFDEMRDEIPIKDYRVKETGYCESSRYSECKTYFKQIIHLGFPDIVNINFGMPIEKSVNEDTKSISYISEPVNWTALGKLSKVYKDTSLHQDIKILQSEIKNIETNIDDIKEEFNISNSIADKAKNEMMLDSCNEAINMRDTITEIQSCLANINSPENLITVINNSKTDFGYEIKDIFNSVTDNDLGYDNFEQLLNSYGQSRNAIKAVTSIQGAYEFLEVPNGNYVLFTYYEDRFNGVGHWFEEITIAENKKIDLNNLNYKKEGIYSYLRDKIEE